MSLWSTSWADVAKVEHCPTDLDYSHRVDNPEYALNSRCTLGPAPADTAACADTTTGARCPTKGAAGPALCVRLSSNQLTLHICWQV